MKARRFIFLLVFIILITSLSGCMKNQNEEIKMEDMKSYASDKYGREFTVENFQAAKDETYTNILSLSDGDHVFNVYQSGSSEESDDYPLAIVNTKFTEHLKDITNSGFYISANFMFADGNNMTLDYAKSNEIADIIADYSLLKVVVVIVVDENISDCSQELFGIYKEVMSFNPEYIDFEVIQANSITSELSDMLNNLPAFYDSDWNKHSAVVSYLSVTDKNIASADDLTRGVK